VTTRHDHVDGPRVVCCPSSYAIGIGWMLVAERESGEKDGKLRLSFSFLWQAKNLFVFFFVTKNWNWSFCWPAIGQFVIFRKIPVSICH